MDSPASGVIRVAALSDCHGRLPQVDDIPLSTRLVLVAGDTCPLEDHSLSAQQKWLKRELAPWLDALQERGVSTVAVAGNHDFIFAAPVDSDIQVPLLNWTYLQDSSVELAGLTIHGLPWISHMPGGWAFTAPSSFGGDFLANRCAEISPDTDIIISHSPPFGLRDVEAGGEHIGSRPLATAVRRIKPRLVVCGHVHEGFGVTDVGSLGGGWGTTVANVSLLNWDYQPSHMPTLFDVPLDRTQPVTLVKR